MPIGSYAIWQGDKIWLRALVGAPDGSEIVRGERLCDPQDAAAAGVSLAEELLDNGARYPDGRLSGAHSCMTIPLPVPYRPVKPRSALCAHADRMPFLLRSSAFLRDMSCRCWLPKQPHFPEMPFFCCQRMRFITQMNSLFNRITCGLISFAIMGSVSQPPVALSN